MSKKNTKGKILEICLLQYIPNRGSYRFDQLDE